MGGGKEGRTQAASGQGLYLGEAGAGQKSGHPPGSATAPAKPACKAASASWWWTGCNDRSLRRLMGRGTKEERPLGATVTTHSAHLRLEGGVNYQTISGDAALSLTISR